MGEDYIVINAKSKLDKKIAAYEEYLKKMEKKDKGYVYNSFSVEQLHEREEITKKIEHLVCNFV